MQANRAISNTQTKRTRRAVRGGFSLIELVLVMTIISVLAAIAVPRYANALARYRADAAAQRIVTDLNYARERARSTSTKVIAHIKPSEDCLRLEDTPSLDDSTEIWETDLSAKPYLADIVSTSFLSGKVSFDGYGTPDAGGSIQLTVGSESRTVVLDADTGKAVVQ